MSETASVEELERIAQAIALSDGFQLLVLECVRPDGLDRLLAEVSDRVTTLRGEPPTILTITDPHRLVGGTFASKGSVLILDGSDVTVRSTDGVSGESNWRFLFQRLNERRNAIMRSQASTLILALSPALRRIFFEEAPDMASIRSGMFNIDASRTRHVQEDEVDFDVALQQEAMETPAREVDANDRLRELLLVLFRTSELYRFVRYNFPELTLPERVSPSDVALAVVNQLGERGWIGRNLLERLARVRPDHRDEIDDVAQLCSVTLGSPAEQGAGSSVTSDLHEGLLALTPGQRDAVMYLARLFGDDSANTTRTARERPRTSARALFARAHSEGPEALARLADAIDLVTERD